MSHKFSTIPALQLTVNTSLHRQLFVLFMAAAVGLANLQVYLKGYPVLCVVLSLASVVLLWKSWRDPMRGAVLKWEDGEWFLRLGGRQTSVLLLPGAVRLPWVIYLAFRETHARQRWAIWLFADSVDVEQMRRLRCRLAVEPAR